MAVATSCSPKNFQLMHSLGASQCIDYHTERLQDALHDVDVFIDTRGYEFEDLVLSADCRVMKRGEGLPSHYVRVASSPYSDAAGTDPLGLGIPESRLDRIATGFAKAAWSRLAASSVQYHIVYVHPDGEALREIAQAMAEGKIFAVVQETLPLQEASRAHELLEKGHVTGKLVLLVQDEKL